MDVKKQLGTAIENYGATLGIKKKNVAHAAIAEIELPEEANASRTVRDALIEVGEILEEDLDSGLYIATVKAGAANANPALVVAIAEAHGAKLGACAKEGLIKQSTAKKAIEKVRKASFRRN